MPFLYYHCITFGLMFTRNHISGLLLAAFLAWLFHSVVPHHHHGGEICFNSHHCHEKECSGENTSGGTCQSHDHDGTHDVCFLKQISFLPVYKNKVVAQSVQVRHFKTDLTLAAIAEPEDQGPGPGVMGQTGRQWLGSPPSFHSREISSSGLRAPPAV